MHVFLTGEKQCGKSTAIARALQLMNKPLYGFRTLFTDRYDTEKALYMLPAAYQGEPQADAIVTQFVNNRPQALTEQFDVIGCRLLQEAQQHPEGVILMDECSRFEKNALLFQQEIMRCLAGNIPVLGVIRLNAEGWVDQIRCHPGVKLVTVTEANRDTLPEKIVQWLND